METHELSERRRKLRKKAITLRGVYEGSVADHTVFARVIFVGLRTPLTESSVIYPEPRYNNKCQHLGGRRSVREGRPFLKRIDTPPQRNGSVMPQPAQQ